MIQSYIAWSNLVKNTITWQYIAGWCYFGTLVCHIDYLGGVNGIEAVGGGCGGVSQPGKAFS